VSTPIFHLALARDWDAALATGEYAVSTRGRTLADEGFIHASWSHQWRGVRDRFYGDVTEPLVLLEIVPALLTVEVREEAVPGLEERFPHVYGPIDVHAVVKVHVLGQ
jgi:uncharacterized protein (DUF952 family)